MRPTAGRRGFLDQTSTLGKVRRQNGAPDVPSSHAFLALPTRQGISNSCCAPPLSAAADESAGSRRIPGAGGVSGSGKMESLRCLAQPAAAGLHACVHGTSRNRRLLCPQVLDMVTDRLATAGLLAVLGMLYPRSYMVFLALMFLDIFSHWFQMYSTFISGSEDAQGAPRLPRACCNVGDTLLS